MKLNLKTRAIELRKQGFSHGDIRKKLGISKSTSSLWTKDITLPLEAQNILAIKTEAARKKGRESRSTRIKLKYDLIKKSVIEDLKSIKLSKSLAKLLCSMLYWGEGSKSSGRVVFTNSDPEMVNAFMRLFRYAFVINEDKITATLHLHPYHNERTQKIYWSDKINIPTEKIHIFHKTSYGNVIRNNYQGCIAINYGSMEILNELMYYYTAGTEILFGGFV